VGPSDRFYATSLVDHVGEGETRKVLAHMVAHVSPHAEQDALSLVVTGAVFMGFAKVTGGDGAIDGRHDLGECYRFGCPGEDVPAADPAFGANESSAFEIQEDLLQIRLGESSAFGEVTHRGWRTVIISKGQAQ
jgi:hypothetical protein